MANIFFIFKSDTEFVAPTTSALSNAIATNDALNSDYKNSYSITAASLNTAADVLDTLDDSSSKTLNRLAGWAGKAAPYLGIIQVGIKAVDANQDLELSDVMTLSASLGVLIGSAPLAAVKIQTTASPHRLSLILPITAARRPQPQRQHSKIILMLQQTHTAAPCLPIRRRQAQKTAATPQHRPSYLMTAFLPRRPILNTATTPHRLY